MCGKDRNASCGLIVSGRFLAAASAATQLTPFQLARQPSPTVARPSSLTVARPSSPTVARRSWRVLLLLLALSLATRLAAASGAHVIWALPLSPFLLSPLPFSLPFPSLSPSLLSPLPSLSPLFFPSPLSTLPSPLPLLPFHPPLFSLFSPPFSPFSPLRSPSLRLLSSLRSILFPSHEVVLNVRLLPLASVPCT
ncbi:unnamed protein product [Closterium sp. Yama58-4]|nr:unnamed protein product [Closterium sp. Yama58-4]